MAKEVGGGCVVGVCDVLWDGYLKHGCLRSLGGCLTSSFLKFQVRNQDNQDFKMRGMLKWLRGSKIGQEASLTEAAFSRMRFFFDNFSRWIVNLSLVSAATFCQRSGVRVKVKARVRVTYGFMFFRMSTWR